MVGSKGFEIIKTKPWVFEKGAVPSRIVLMKWF
jgi:hypothetical protein